MPVFDLTPERVRALAEARPENGLVLSVYLDLDPREFATRAARETAVSSLLSDLERQLHDGGVTHAENAAAQADLERLRSFFADALDPDGAQALAVFASEPAGLWEVVRLPHPVASAAHADVRAVVEPLAGLAGTPRYAVLLVNRATARLLRGSRETLYEVTGRTDRVHGQHSAGGWSQPRYERSIENEVDEHLRACAEELRRRHEQRPFDALVVGTPEELSHRAVEALHPELREKFLGHVRVDVEEATPDEVAAAAAELFDGREQKEEATALDTFRQGMGGGEGRGAGGWHDVLGALNERKVETLLLAERPAERTGLVCPQCGWLGTNGEACPIDGTALGRRDDIAEAAIEATVRQGGRVLRLRHHEDALTPHHGVGAVLRF